MNGRATAELRCNAENCDIGGVAPRDDLRVCGCDESASACRVSRCAAHRGMRDSGVLTLHGDVSTASLGTAALASPAWMVSDLLVMSVEQR
jgi:hypothetical protein